MCGIAGILDPGGVARSDLERMTDTLAHRGPDDAAVLVDGEAGLGFRRLSIIDLETGAQPIPNEDGSVWVICNGEIYNYRELRRGLEGRGHRFSTRSDTEVLVHLYEERGADLLGEVRGMFALAVWDGRRRRLLLARDHLGQKPLYWARDGRRFYFASELKAIVAVAPRFRRVDPRALDEYLALRVISDPRSMFEGVRKLAPAHLLSLEGGEPAVRRYWSLTCQPKERLSEAEALERLDQEIREAVRLHLVSDVPVGAFLSGGVDSGLITAMMAEEADAPFHTFSAGLPYGRWDERPAARTVARRLGTIHREMTVGAELVRLLPILAYYGDEPSDPLGACMFELARFARSEVKVALGGDGGDELFGGYDRYYGVPLVRHYAALPRSLRRSVVRRLLGMVSDGSWYKSLGHRLRWMDELAEVDGGRRYARSLSYFYFTPRHREELYTDQFRRAVDGFDPEEAVALGHDGPNLEEQLDRMVMADLRVRLPNHSVMILDRMTMAHGLEARSPFLDHRLAEFAARLPARLKVRGRKRRYLEMRLAERYLPPEVVRRPKQGFSSALPYLMRSEFEALFRRFLPDSHLVEAGWLRRPAIASLLESHVAGRADHGNRLWLLLAAELWQRVHLEQTPVEELTAEVLEALGLDPREAGDPVPSPRRAPAVPAAAHPI